MKCFSLIYSTLCFFCFNMGSLSLFCWWCVGFFALSLTTVFPPKRSLRFLVLLKHLIGMWPNTFPILSFICKMGQCFCIILDTFKAVRLYALTSGVWFSFLEIFVWLSRLFYQNYLLCRFFLLSHWLYSLFQLVYNLFPLVFLTLFEVL